jgi:serine kinase of HPr protein (carbohydrate metabolism regulator)
MLQEYLQIPYTLFCFLQITPSGERFFRGCKNRANTNFSVFTHHDALREPSTHTLDELFAPRKLEVGCMVDILGVGVLIKGKSGIGKSECVLSLLSADIALFQMMLPKFFFQKEKSWSLHRHVK